MLTVKNLDNGTTFEVKPTIFPDRTSQVWKLPLDGLRYAKIMWQFESEGEIVHLNQLMYLLHQNNTQIVEIYIPFLPYGRQDKEISNESTFALTCFLNGLPDDIKWTTLDVHNPDVTAYKIKNFTAERYIKKAIDLCYADILVFPDYHAQEKYMNLPGIASLGLEHVSMWKERDQLTGQILSQKIHASMSNFKTLAGKRLLMVDDICDGGWTFTSAAQMLKAAEPNMQSLSLYVTHGIFSKGFAPLWAAGISDIYTTQSLVKNDMSFLLEEF